MGKISRSQIERHINTYSERTVDDRNAVVTLQNFLKSDGRLNDDFKYNDKKPNIDGTLELVSNPRFDRRPEQNFVVQIKGTSIENFDNDGTFKYRLKDLAFPAYICNEKTFDPGLLFVVLNPNIRGKEKVFWKYMSAEFISNIDFDKSSMTIRFTELDEIKNTDESIALFAEHLLSISERHSIVKSMEATEYSQQNIIDLLKVCDDYISDCIERFDIYNDTRDNLSKKLLTKLEDLCRATLLLNNLLHNDQYDIRTAWEYSLTRLDTKFLGVFFQSLRYIGRRIPEEGQNERLMLKYYDFLWQIRKYLSEQFDISILSNLELFPLNLDEDDRKYYVSVGKAIDTVENNVEPLKSNRYYIKNKTTFYIGKERYFEITLQLSELYATKYNRLTVYTKLNISSNYPIRIGYQEASVKLWNNESKIKVVTNWRVSIEPAVLNKLAVLLGKELRISSKYGEYDSLMNYLTNSGINFLDLIDFNDARFNVIIDSIYSNVNTSGFKKVLQFLKQHFSEKKQTRGRNIIRYIILRLREEVLDNVKNVNENDIFIDHLLLSKRCIPFERNPLLYNLPRNKTHSNTISRDVIRAVGLKNSENKMPYIQLKKYSENTGEIYCPLDYLDEIVDQTQIQQFNSSLTDWDIRQGCRIEINDAHAYITDYESTTLSILSKLSSYTSSGNEGQKQLNNKFLRDGIFDEIDECKIDVLRNVFVNSKLIIIYGAAGTGKTTLLNYISNLMENRCKVFLAKTHTALENLQRKIKAPGLMSEFLSLDSFLKRDRTSSYDIVFVDECSTIDNRSMNDLLNKLDSNALLVLAGDTYQIESIDFGNWFLYAKDIINSKSTVELTNTWRTDIDAIISLWDEVRFRKPLITEKLVIDGPFSENLSDGIFSKAENDEVVLCLNYDGKFGLNNINNYFQDSNEQNEAFSWKEWIYKIGDPILFNDSKRFPELYNNLKGRIVDIFKEDDRITFVLKIDLILTSVDVRYSDFEIVKTLDDSTIIMLTMYENRGGVTDEEREEAHMKSIVPFQIAYAVSIHKSQGLEYDSVKIVIPNSNSEKITHGIFYTAITRAKKKLKIYWSSETMDKVVKSFQEEERNKPTLSIIKRKLLEHS